MVSEPELVYTFVREFPGFEVAVPAGGVVRIQGPPMDPANDGRGFLLLASWGAAFGPNFGLGIFEIWDSASAVLGDGTLLGQQAFQNSVSVPVDWKNLPLKSGVAFQFRNPSPVDPVDMVCTVLLLWTQKYRADVAHRL